MKEIRISLKLKIALRRHDVHWIEEELLRLREDIFLGILERVLEEVEEEALKKHRVPAVRWGDETERAGAEAIADAGGEPGSQADTDAL